MITESLKDGFYQSWEIVVQHFMRVTVKKIALFAERVLSRWSLHKLTSTNLTLVKLIFALSWKLVFSLSCSDRISFFAYNV